MRKTFFVTLFLAFSLAVFAQDEPTKVRCVCGPYLQNVQTDEFTVMFVSDIDALAWVEIAPDDGTSFYQKERPKYFDESGFGVHPICKLHRITVRGLESGTRYRYRIMMKGIRSYKDQYNIVFTKTYGDNVYSKEAPIVTTLSKSYDKVRFAVVNDMHGHPETIGSLFSNMKKGDYDFVCYNGDMTSWIYDENDIVKSYMDTTAKLFAQHTPLYAARGNHEYRGKDAVRWPAYFSTSTEKPYYSFSYGRFFFVVLDGGEDKPDSDIEYQGTIATDSYIAKEAEWLKQTLQGEEAKKAARIIVFCHMPPRENKLWHGEETINNIFVPILNDAGCCLMISAHEHKWRIAEPGYAGAKFPVFVNSNKERLDVEVSDKSISMSSWSTAGVRTHTLELK